MKEETFASRDGLRIQMRSWHPPAPLAVVVLCHGVNSHSGQYLWVAGQLQAAGFAVYAFDLRGRGSSEGARFYIDDVSDYTYALDHQAELAGLICESFAFEVPAPAIVLGLVRLLGRIAPRLPVLIMHGTADKATVPAGSQFFYQAAGSRDKTLKLYEGHYHDLLNDIGKQDVMNEIVAWINARRQTHTQGAQA